MLNDLEKLQAVRESGHWWEVPWWRNPIYIAESRLQLEQVESAFEALREVFNERWAKEQTDGRHLMLIKLFGSSGLGPFIFLHDLGHGIKSLRDKNLLGNLVRRLRAVDEFDGACAELSALAQWVEAGVRVERDVPSGHGNKNCDWKVSDGKAVIFGEVKRIQLARNNSEKTALSERISGQVLERMSRLGIQGEFELQLLIRPVDLIDVQEFARTAEKITEKIVSHFKANREKTDTGWQIVEDLAKYRHVPGENFEGLHGGMSGIPYDMRAEGDKIMDVVEEASEQLPLSGPGVVMISGGGRASSLPFAEETGKRIEERFRLAGDACRHIAGVVTVRSYLIPERGLMQFSVFAKNPIGGNLDLDLLKRGFQNLVVWEDGLVYDD